MSAHARHFKIGVFVISAAALMLIGLTLLGAGALFRNTVTFETYIDGSVEGLDVGAPVKYRGVRIGTVSTIDFASLQYPIDRQADARQFGDFILVRLAIREEVFGELSLREVEEATLGEVRRGLRVRMAISSLTGPAHIEVTHLDPDKFPPPDIPWDPPALYVPSAPSQLRLIVDAVTTILTDLSDAGVSNLIGDVRAVMDAAKQDLDALDLARVQDESVALVGEMRESNRRLREILESPELESAVADLASSLGSARRILGDGEQDLAAFASDLPAISERLRSAAERLDEILSDPQLRKLLDSLASASDQAGPAVDDFRRLVLRLDRLIASEQQDIRSIVNLLHETLDNLEAVSEEAGANPSRVLFGEPPPRKER